MGDLLTKNSNDINQLNEQMNIKLAPVRSAISAADDYTNQKFAQATQEIGKVKDEANAGTASEMAMAAIPQPDNGYAYSVGMGVGTYGSQNAVALGAKFDVAKNISATLSSSYDSQHNFGGSAGVGYSF